jgi:ubiquinone/menaquinone biosynthesis C-methylase UbiE
MIRHRQMALVAALAVWAVSMAAVALFFAGKKWLWFGAGTAAAMLTVHIVLNHVALGLGGLSLFGYIGRWIRPQTAEDGPATTGKVIHWAWAYDPLVWLVTLGRPRKFRERTLDLAALAPGESVLDIGCGTGSAAIAAKRRVGPAGKVIGIDPSAEMIARARRKAARAGIDVAFERAVAEKLPFPDGAFDALLSTVMLHHLPDDARRKCIEEVRRVLKPGGRFIAVDFGGDAGHRHNWIGRQPNHAHFDLGQVIPALNEAGLRVVESGPAGFGDLQFVRAASPS